VLARHRIGPALSTANPDQPTDARPTSPGVGRISSGKDHVMAKRPVPGAFPARACRVPGQWLLSVTGLGLLIGAVLATASVTPVITPIGVSAAPQIELVSASAAIVPDAGGGRPATGTSRDAGPKPATPKHPSIPTPPKPPAPPPMPAIPAPPGQATADPDSTPTLSDPSVASPTDPASTTPAPADTAPALPGTTAPAAMPGQPAAVPAACATSWALTPPNDGLAIPNVPNAASLCGAGAIRPTPLTTACTKQVNGAGLQAAVDAAKPGDRICASGTSPARLKVTRSGTPAAPILVLGDGRTTVKGLTIDANNVTVGGLNLTNPTAPGVEMSGNGITLVNNTIASPRGDDGDGIRFFGTNLRILHNTVSDVRNLHGAHADCMQTFASDTPASQRVLIDSNRCEKIDNQCLIAEGPNSSAGDGSKSGRSSDITFTRNYCDSNASQAVMIDDVQNVSVTHNQITGGNEKAFAFDNKSTGAKVLGNILGLHIGFEVGMDGSSKHGYLGPLIGGLP
jgi:hypothetical protein